MERAFVMQLILTSSLCSAWGFSTAPALRTWSPSCVKTPHLGKRSVVLGRQCLIMSMSVANQWAEACDSAGVAAPAQAIAPGDLAVLLRAAMSGEPKRSDTFAEVGGGRGEAMAVQTYTHIYIYISIYMYTYVCTYKHMYIHVKIYTYIYI